MGLKIKTEKIDEKITYLLDGVLDLSTADNFKESVEKEYLKNPSNIEIDFKNIDFIDSTCLGVMVSLSKQLSDEHRICVINLKDHIKKVFTITGLDKIFICKGEK